MSHTEISSIIDLFDNNTIMNAVMGALIFGSVQFILGDTLVLGIVIAVYFYQLGYINGKSEAEQKSIRKENT